MSAVYLQQLDAELRARGIAAPLRRRILEETDDHLRSDREAVTRFGEPAAIAQRFADELGATSARRAALQAFAVLAATGVLFGSVVLAWAATGSLRTIADSGTTSPVALLVVAVLVLAPQVSFVAGVLAVLRALRRRSRRQLPAAEVDVIHHRTLLALACGCVGLMALVGFSRLFAAALPAWSTAAVAACAAAGSLLLLGGGVSLRRAARMRGAVPGTAGDIFNDLGPLAARPSGGSAWVFAVLVSAASAVAVFGAGALAADGIDGAIRGLAEGTACFAGFAIFGTCLGLRSPSRGGSRPAAAARR